MSLIRCTTSKALKFRQLLKMAARTSVTTPVSKEPFSIEDHSLHFKIERYWAAGMIPLIPTAYFIHTPAMDAVLTVAIVLHVHWGIAGVVSDYARPFVIGDTLARVARASVYIITVILLASLLHFNNSDVGLTKAFEMMNSWSDTFLWSFLAALLIWILIRLWYKLTSGQCAFEESLKGKVFLVTGCTSGIGYETAKELYGHDATVVMLIRNVKKGLECMQRIRTIYPYSNGEIRIVPVDLSSLRNVRLCARMINNTEPVINVLVNNAAIGSKEGHKASLTSDSLEEVMASNYFGHFLLTMLLLPRLRATKGTRIINISSLVHSLHGHLPTDSLNFEKEYYDGFNAYIRSKLAIVIMSRHLSRLVSVHDAAFFSCNPGILATQLSKYFIRKFFGKRLGDLIYPLAMFVNKLVAKTTHEGAQTTLSLCVQKGVEQHNGKYFSDCRPARNSPLADDVELGRRLFQETVRLVGLRQTALHTQLNTTSSPLDAAEFCGTGMYDDKNLSSEDSAEDSKSESEQDIEKSKFFKR